MRSITFVKSVHTAIFVLLSGLLAVFLYEVIADDISILTWIAIALFIIEGIVLIANGWKCPLTTYAERLGAARGSVTHIFLPRWLAERVFPIYGGLFAAGLLLLALRILL